MCSMTIIFAAQASYVAFPRSSPIILTSASDKQTLPSGYYDEFTISSNVPTTGTVTYVHHVHSTTNSAGEEVENSSASTSSVTSMPESQSTSGGCYTRGVSYSYRCGSWVFVSGNGASSSGCWNTFRCSGCGQTNTSWCVADANGSGWGIGDHYVSGTNYYCSHNYSNGQIIRAIITY